MASSWRSRSATGATASNGAPEAVMAPETAPADVAQAGPLHRARELRGRDEAVHRPRQVGVGLAVARDERAEGGHDAAEVEAEEGAPHGHVGAHDLERQHTAARHRHAPHLPESGLEVLEVPQEEGRHHARERSARKGQGERVAGDERHAPGVARAELGARLAQHALGEVAADDETRRVERAQREGQVRGAGREVERGAGERRGRQPRHVAAPRVVAAARHERVHPVVARGDAREHHPDRVGPLGHDH